MERTHPLDACLHCGQPFRHRALTPGQTAACGRCGATLYRSLPGMIHRALALTLAGLVLFGLANAFPLLALRIKGVQLEITLLDACLTFWRGGYIVLSALLCVTLVLVPLLQLAGLSAVLLSARLGLAGRQAARLYRWVLISRPWGMLEVFLLGLLVALVKLGDLATLVVGPAFWSLCGLIAALAALQVSVDPFTLWQRLAPRGRP